MRKMTKADKAEFVEAVEAANARGVQRGYGRPAARIKLMQMTQDFGKPALDTAYREHFNEEPPQ